MEFAVGEVAEKRVTIDKNSFVEGRQESYSDAITTIANLDAFCAFLCECNTREGPDIVRMMRDLADFLSQSEFKEFAEKHEHKSPWLTHTIVCALHSILRSFVLVANDFTYQRQVEHNKNIEVSALQKCWDIYENIEADFTLSLASSTPRAFAIPPGSY